MFCSKCGAHIIGGQPCDYCGDEDYENFENNFAEESVIKKLMKGSEGFDHIWGEKKAPEEQVVTKPQPTERKLPESLAEFYRRYAEAGVAAYDPKPQPQQQKEESGTVQEPQAKTVPETVPFDIPDYEIGKSDVQKKKFALSGTAIILSCFAVIVIGGLILLAFAFINNNREDEISFADISNWDIAITTAEPTTAAAEETDAETTAETTTETTSDAAAVTTVTSAVTVEDKVLSDPKPPEYAQTVSDKELSEYKSVWLVDDYFNEARMESELRKSKFNINSDEFINYSRLMAAEVYHFTNKSGSTSFSYKYPKVNIGGAEANIYEKEKNKFTAVQHNGKYHFVRADDSLGNSVLICVDSEAGSIALKRDSCDLNIAGFKMKLENQTVNSTNGYSYKPYNDDISKQFYIYADVVDDLHPERSDKYFAVLWDKSKDKFFMYYVYKGKLYPVKMMLKKEAASTPKKDESLY